MEALAKAIELGKELGYKEDKLQQFVEAQQAKFMAEQREKVEREEREAERQARREEAEIQARREEAEIQARREEAEIQARREEAERRLQEQERLRQHELELRKLELEQSNRGTPNSTSTSDQQVRKTIPKLPPFKDGQDDLDSYLQRFERFATNQRWERTEWATYLSALLSGVALDVYSRLSDDDATDYDELKKALLTRYNLTEEGYRLKFRQAKPLANESPKQLIIRMGKYLEKWIDLSNTEKSVEGITLLFTKEQFLRACPRDLATYLSEQEIQNDLDKLADVAERYLKAHRRQLHEANSDKRHETQQQKTDNSNKSGPTRCYNCNGIGHIAAKCFRPKMARQDNKVTYPGKDNFKTKAAVASAQPCSTNPENEEKAACAAIAEANLDNDAIILYDGTRMPLVKGGGGLVDERMILANGAVNGSTVQTLRDTGCTGVLLKKSFIKEEQYTGKTGIIQLLNNTLLSAPYARVEVDTPYYKGEVNALCLDDMICDLIIGNIEGARERNDPTTMGAAVVTRAEAKRTGEVTPLRVAKVKDLEVSREELIKMQRDDETLQKFFNDDDTNHKGKKDARFEIISQILYRIYTDRSNSRPAVKQLVLPKELRTRVMEQAHSTIMGAHQGVKKTTDRILGSFYWPNLKTDVINWCRSCDVCQKTVAKGSERRVPLGSMPTVEQPFKRVAVDLVGPISPPSEKGHRYILTMVDYATRYPEAVALKNIDTETVAEALVDIYSRLGIPEQVLSDLGTQFVSDCMQEVSRLLSVKQLTTTPYHPMCNGLVEKFNGTLKQMLKRLCSEQPKQWHRYINALLFAYREVPQESTGFAPFELLYGRTVRGPMNILRELWTKDVGEPEVRNSYQYVFELRERLEQTLAIATQNLEKAKDKQKFYYDKRSRPKNLMVGDKVLILLPTDSNKLLMQWKGPYSVTEIVGLNDYAIEMNGKRKVYHANLLKKYYERLQNEPKNVSVAAGTLMQEVACTAVVEDYANSTPEDLLELCPTVAQESAADLRISDELQDEQRDQLNTLISNYRHIFSDLPGCTRIITHKIELKSPEPIRSKPYPVPYAVRDQLKADINSMLEMGVIRRSNSPYAAPVVVVKKPDGSNRICLDFRKLNKITVVDPEPMTTIQDVLERIGNDQFFSTFDLSKGYWQIKMAEEDIPKTAFVTPDGEYEFLRMPFGMVNAGATLVRGMRELLDGAEHVENYLDDIIVHTETFEQHLIALEELFKRLEAAGLTVRPTKCTVAAQRVKFIGHQIGSGLKTPLEDNIAKIRQAPKPKTKTEVRSFIGLTGFYRDYIPNYSAIAAPLTDMTKKGQPRNVIWTDAAESAFRDLKLYVTSRPILHLPDITKTFTLQTDASETGLGAVLLQETSGKLFPISYASKKLTETERRYSTMERECLAVIWAVKKFSCYLYGKEFTLQTDHQPLVYLNKARYDNDRIMRWALFLQNYQVKIESIKGKDNNGADFLSRT